MIEATHIPYPEQYPATEAARQVAQSVHETAFSRYSGVDPATIPEYDYARATAPEVTPVVAPEQEPEPVKPYILKRLQSRDIFPMLRILSKINFKELKACFSSPEIAVTVAKLSEKEGEDGKNMSADEIFSAVGVGVVLDVAGVIINNIPYCENELYSFLSSLSGMKNDEIMNLDAVVFFEMIVDVIKKPEFKDFIKVASGLLK